MARNTTAAVSYVLADGTSTRHARADAESLSVKFGDETTLPVAMADISEPNRVAAGFYGLAVKLNRATAGSKTVAEARTAVETMIELLGGNMWVEAREGRGPAPGLLLEAIVNAIKAAGKKITDKDRETIRAKLREEGGRKRAMANPRYAAEYQRMRIARDTERLAEMESAAEGATVGVDF